MAQYNVSADTTLGINTLADDDKWIVDEGVLVDAADDNAFFGVESFTNNTIVVRGTVQTMGNYITMLMLGNETAVMVDVSGTVNSSTQGIAMLGERSVVINKGHIQATEIGVKVTGSKSFFNNEGTIVSDNTAVQLSGPGSELENHGTISGLVGVNIRAQSGTIEFHNAGIIAGTLYAIVCGNADEEIRNEGVINGHVYLRGGNDVFTLAAGSVNGNVYGGNGHDTYHIDNASISIIETENGGVDAVSINSDYTLGAFLENLALIGEGDIAGTGNDLSNSIEGTSGNNALLGLHGGDRLSGLAGTDMLDGGTGRDILFGGDGTDTLLGGGGRDALDGGGETDVLTGGGGADRFVFKDGYGIDTITDFVARGRRHDLIDLSDFDGINSFRDLKLHHIRRSGDDLIIVNGSGDELILEDTGRSELRRGDFDL